MTGDGRHSDAPARRVVSLVPSVTETLLAWGIEPVACTRFCEQPSLRHVGGTKDPDIGAIVALRPDLVVMDREENRLPDAEALRSAGLAVHATHVTSLQSLPGELDALAVAVGAEVTAMELGAPAPPVGRVVVLIWKRPWMALGPTTYGSTVLEHLGWSCLLPSGVPYPEVDLASVRTRRPDLVLLPSEPYPFAERHCAQIAEQVGAPAHCIDGRDLLWWGARTSGAIDRLHAVLGGFNHGSH